jgi:hypothetical protein
LNLVSLYDTVEVSIESIQDKDAKSSGIVAYSFTLPAEGLTHLRYLLSSYPNTPDQTALIQGLFTDIGTIRDLAIEMQKAADKGDEVGLTLNAEAINNVVVGNQSPSHKDLNNDSQVEDPSDGFGLLLNGRNQGYLEAVYAEVDATVKSAGASQPMIDYGNGSMISVQNLAQWTPELQNLITSILAAQSGPDRKNLVADAVALANKMLNGIDIDEDGKIDPKPGEGGAQVAYDQVYHMADMPLRPVGILNFGTGTPTFVIIPATTLTAGGGPGTGVPTQRIPPGQQHTPPGPQNRTPKPQRTNNGTGHH